MTDIERPYAEGAEVWSDAGWSPLPLPPRQKASPPEGYTGAAGIDADAQQVATWIEQQPDANIGLRMPVGVCGIDVDAYKDSGRASWAALQAKCGPLPATWMLTSRTDGESGIRLFKIPPTVKLRGVAAPGIEVLQHHHRYAVTWPSVHPDTGNIYRLIGPDGDDDCDLPHPSDLPDLPASWLAELTEKPREPGVAAPKPSTGEWSRAVTTAFAEGMAGMVKGSRHDTALACVAALARLELQEHPGATEAIESIGTHFRSVITDRCDDAHAQKEWDDIVAGGRALVRSAGSYRDTYTDLKRGPAEVTQLMGNGTQPQVSGNDDPQVEVDGQDHGWHPVDFAVVLHAGYQPPEPHCLFRDDDVALFYPGRVNGLLGESGSGKSWVALCAAAQELNDAGQVLYIDLEDHAASLAQRLIALGVTKDNIERGLFYVQPELGYGMDSSRDTEQLVADQGVTLVVIDSVGEAMALQAMKQNDDDEVARWFRMLPRRLAALGPAVVLVDHVPKSKDAPAGFAIGSQRKRAAIDGHSIRTEQVKPLGRGRAGVVKLITAKDRNGTHPTGFPVGELHLDARGTQIEWHLSAPTMAPTAEDGSFRPTVYMERVSRLLELNPGLSGRQIEEGCNGKGTYVRAALRCLIDESFVTATPKGGGFAHAVTAPFRDPSNEVPNLIEKDDDLAF